MATKSLQDVIKAYPFFRAKYDVSVDKLKDYRAGVDSLESALIDLKYEQIHEVRLDLLDVCCAIDTLYKLCADENYSRKVTANIVKGAYPTLTKDERSKARYFVQNASNMLDHLAMIESTAYSLDRMHRIYSNHVKKQEKESRKNNILFRDFSDMKPSNNEPEQIDFSKVNTDVRTSDLFMMFGKVIYAMSNRASDMTFDELMKTIEGCKELSKSFESELTKRQKPALKVVNE